MSPLTAPPETSASASGDPKPNPRLDWLAEQHRRLDGLRTRYEWSSLPPVFAPHSFVGGDLAAMTAPWPGMARDDLGTYAEPVVVHIEADLTEFRAQIDRFVIHPAAGLMRLMADVHEFGVKADAFDDGRAYETGSRCRTDSAALRRAGEHLADGADGARRAALVLAGYAGADATPVPERRRAHAEATR